LALKTFVAVAAVATLALTGCASRGQRANELRQAGEAACAAQYPPKVGNYVVFARCIIEANNQVYMSMDGRYPDLLDTMAAVRLKVAAMMDRGEMSKEDADLQISIARSQLVAEEQRRLTQRAAAVAPYLQILQNNWAARQQNGTAIAAPVLTPPHNNSFNCTALPTGGGSASINCY
jgi:hypothetical protein